MAQVRIKSGIHAGKLVQDKTFNIVRGLSIGVRGPFLLVNGEGVLGFPQRNFKIFVSKPEDFEITGHDADQFKALPARRHSRETIAGAAATVFVGAGNVFGDDEPETDETDDEIRDRLSERFEVLEQMTQAAARGTIKGLVVSGAPGVGKSFGVEYALNKDSLIDKLAFNPDCDDQDKRRVGRKGSFKPRYKIIKGHMSAPALYRKLYEYSAAREVIAFDDCDSVLLDDTSLNLLKAALDTSAKREISWINSSRNDELPDTFEFKGSVIFITNINFERTIAKGSKLGPHLEAIMSRCLYLDLTINTLREKLVRIDYVARDLKMLEKGGLSPEQAEEVMDFVHTNASRFRELSLRKVNQVADIRKMDRNWRRVAELTVLKNR